MKLLWLVMNFIISPCTAIPNTPKLCIHCKHFTKHFFTTNEFGKCLMFVREKEKDFVTGKIQDTKPDYFYCSTARSFSNMCGEEGKCYNQKD